MRVVLTPAAAADLEQICDYIAQDNPVRAVSLVDEIAERMTKLAALPQGGQLRPEWGNGIRSTTFASYVIVWRSSGDALEVLRVVHGARDLGKLFRQEPLE